MNLSVLNSAGEAIATIEANDSVFASTINKNVVHQVMLAQMANLRQGTVKTKTRAEVAGGGRKIRPQKHTGGARQGSNRAPHWRGGGIAFGPRPRSYRQVIPKKLKRLAINSMLTDKVQSNEMIVLDDFGLNQPKTKQMVQVLKNLNIPDNKSVLIVTKDSDHNVVYSARNLQKIRTLPAPLLNVLDLIKYQKLLITVDAIRKAEELWGNPVKRGIANGKEKSAPADLEIKAVILKETNVKATAAKPKTIKETKAKLTTAKPKAIKETKAKLTTAKPKAIKETKVKATAAKPKTIKETKVKLTDAKPKATKKTNTAKQ